MLYNQLETDNSGNNKHFLEIGFKPPLFQKKQKQTTSRKLLIPMKL